MKCSRCGFSTENLARFCPNCGAEIVSVVTAGSPTVLDGVETASPWRRWSARVFDNWLGTNIFVCILVPILQVNGILGQDTFLLSLFFLPFALCFEALQYWVFGGTFGKWVFSVKVLDSTGVKIRGGEYAKRLFPVWVSGLGFGIPLVTLITEVIQYNRLKEGKSASYDEKTGRIVVQYKQGFVKGLVCILFILAMLGLMSVAASNSTQ